MPDNIKNEVGLHHCFYKKNGKDFTVEKGITFYLNSKDDNVFFVDERCIGGKTTNPEKTISEARWAFIYDVFYQSFSTAKSDDITKNLWGTLQGGTESVSKYALGTNYKVGSSINFNPSGYSYYFGFKQRIELFSKSPGTGFYFNVIPIGDSEISYAYFNKSEDIKHYGESVSLQIMLHGYNLEEGKNYLAKLYLVEEDKAKGKTETDDFEDINLWKDAKIIRIPQIKGAVSSNVNSYIKENFPIDIEWRKGQSSKKNFTVILEIYSETVEPGKFYGTNKKEERVKYRNFADEPTNDLQEYDTKLLEIKDIDNKTSISSRFIVSAELMDDYLFRIETDKKNQIQYIGDIRYTKKEFDPCGYSKITLKDESDSERESLIIFDEDDTTNPIDRTSQVFGIIRGDERKNVSITLDKLTNKDAFCQGILLEPGQKHSKQKNVFQVDKVYAAMRDKNGTYITVADPSQKGDTDVQTDHQKAPKNTSEIQQWVEYVDYKIDSNEKITLMLRYLYNKTAFESVQKYTKSDLVHEAINFAWLFRYFMISNKLIQNNYLPVSTCRYPNQITKINVYPDIEWTVKLQLSSTVPNTYSHTNMPSGGSFEGHQKKSLEAGQNRKWLNKEVSFELTIKAKTGAVERSIGIAYEDKIKTLLNVLIKVKEGLDNLTGVSSAKKGSAAAIADKLPGFLGKSPITFQLDYPVISIEGGWKFDINPNTNQVEPQGKLSVALTPLIKGTGKLDLITCAEFIPPAKPIIAAIRTACKVVGAEIWFNLYAFGQIDINYTFLFGAIAGSEPIDVATTVGIGAELGVKASGDVPKLSFGSKTTENMDIGFEASAKGETSIIISGKQGSTNEGIYIEPSIGFGGMVVTVTAKANVWKMGIGFEDKPYELIEPKPDLLKGRYYIIKGDNDKK